MSLPKKPRCCRICKEMFQPRKALQNVCSFECEVKLGIVMAERSKNRREKAERVAEVASRKLIKLKLEKLKTPHQIRSELIQQTEKAVRDYRRVYELKKGSGCISCGRSQRDVLGSDGWKHGGAFDAGHYHGKGARPNLRLTPDNIWLQCKSCNGGSSKYAIKGATVAKQYRENLIAEIGLDRVEELDADDKPRHWTIEELKAIKSEYKQKLKELTK